MTILTLLIGIVIGFYLRNIFDWWMSDLQLTNGKVEKVWQTNTMQKKSK